MKKVAWDAMFISKVNTSYFSIDLPMISKLDSTKLHIIVLLHSYACISGDQSCDAFKRTLDIIHNLEDDDELEGKLLSYDLSATIE